MCLFVCVLRVHLCVWVGGFGCRCGLCVLYVGVGRWIGGKMSLKQNNTEVFT